MDSRIILFLLGFLLYSNTFFHDFVLDDAIVISENQYVKQGIQGLKDIFTKDSFAGFFGVEGKDKLVAGGRYRPLSLATFALEVSLFGLQPLSGHIINAISYGVLAIIVFNVFNFFFNNKNTAFWLAAIFIAHPIHTEVVANIKGRDELMAMIFSMAALWLVLKRGSHLLAALLFFAGLLSKENTITFLAIIPLTIWFSKWEGIKKMALTLLPFLVVTLIFLWIRFRITEGFQGGQSFELLNNPFLTLDSGNYRLMNWVEKTALISLTLGKYLQLMVFPYPLSHDYYPMVFAHQGWSILTPWLAMTLNIFLFILGCYGLWRKKIWGYGILFYFITLSIVSNVFFPVGTNMSERFIFMPSLGLLFLLTNFKRPMWIGITVIFSMLTFIRNFDWKDNLTLFSKDIEVSTQSAKLNNALGGVLIENAIKNTPFNQSELKKAERYLDKAIQIHPTYKNAFLLKGNAAFYLGDYERAISTYRFVLSIDPNYEEARGNLGLAYRDAGRNYGEKLGNIPKAKEFLILAYNILPNDYEVLRLLGVAEGVGGNNEEALKWFEKAIEIMPEDAYANLNLATAYFNLGQVEKGNFFLEKAKMINPSIISGSQ